MEIYTRIYNLFSSLFAAFFSFCHTHKWKEFQWVATIDRFLNIIYIYNWWIHSLHVIIASRTCIHTHFQLKQFAFCRRCIPKLFVGRQKLIVSVFHFISLQNQVIRHAKSFSLCVCVTQVFNDYSHHAVTPSTKQINFFVVGSDSFYMFINFLQYLT